MKNIGFFLVVIACLISFNAVSQEELSPYYHVTELTGNMEEITQEVRNTISSGGFEVIAQYHPAENPDLMVICFTNQDLKNLSLQFNDRGTLASVLKAGLVKKGQEVSLSILNPEYMFLAYWGEQMNGQEKEVKEMSEKVVKLFKSMGKLEPFGGTVKRKDLPDYHYMMTMPYFNEPVDLNEFASFQEGLETIRANLDAKAGNTVQIFEQLFDGKDIAVFGVGLRDLETGEAAFLPIIGENNIANLPYEIILEGNKASMLHGKYRIALFWPELKMGTFMKISSTPGEIEETLEKVAGVEED